MSILWSDTPNRIETGKNYKVELADLYTVEGAKYSLVVWYKAVETRAPWFDLCWLYFCFNFPLIPVAA